MDKAQVGHCASHKTSATDKFSPRCRLNIKCFQNFTREGFLSFVLGESKNKSIKLPQVFGILWKGIGVGSGNRKRDERD